MDASLFISAPRRPSSEFTHTNICSTEEIENLLSDRQLLLRSSVLVKDCLVALCGFIDTAHSCVMRTDRALLLVREKAAVDKLRRFLLYQKRN